jgi:hypothetical protein
MPRAADRPSRRLEAILSTLRRHGVRTFRAADLPGIGTGIQVDFDGVTQEDSDRDNVPHEPQPSARIHTNQEPRPLDELALVAEGRDGPVPEIGRAS